MNNDEDLLKIIDSLIAEHDALRAENDALRAENDALRAQLAHGGKKAGRPKEKGKSVPAAMDLMKYVAVERLRAPKETAVAACERLAGDRGLKLGIDLLSAYNRGKKMARMSKDGPLAKKPAHSVVSYTNAPNEDWNWVFEAILKSKKPA